LIEDDLFMMCLKTGTLKQIQEREGEDGGDRRRLCSVGVEELEKDRCQWEIQC
jgi:hypothetical protein